jgi:hypothetical protein
MLREGFGWLSPEYNLMSWALSCLQLKKYYQKIVLYADSTSAKMLIDELKLPYSEICCNLDVLNSYNSNLWALPKIHTYSVQEKPFISIDGDVFLWKPLDKELVKKELIAQNLETEASYYKPVLEHIKTNLSFLPGEIIDELQTGQVIQSYNAGILGGSDISFFQEYCGKVFEFVNKNSNNLEKINVSSFNTIFEQYFFYCLAKKRNKKVNVLISQIIDDLRYPGFADFPEVPYNKKYLHLHGLYKKSKIICKQMADRLRNDYPEYYYRIISLFLRNNLPLINNAYSYTDEKDEEDLVRRFYFLKQGRISSGHVGNNSAPFSFWRTELCNRFFETNPNEIYPDDLVQQIKDDIKQLEKKIVEVIKEKFSKINKTALYQIDIVSTEYLENIFADNEDIGLKKLVCAEYYEIIPCKFDWTFLGASEISVETKFQRIADSVQEINKAVIVPECYGEGYSLYNADELDMLILEELRKTLSIQTLLEIIAAAFDPEELKDGLEELKLLVYGRIKRGVLNKTIKLAA